MEFYTAKVHQYFCWEYSDFTLEEILEKLPTGNGVDEKKVMQIIAAHFSAGHQPQIPAKKLASVLKSRLKTLFFNESYSSDHKTRLNLALHLVPRAIAWLLGGSTQKASGVPFHGVDSKEIDPRRCCGGRS